MRVADVFRREIAAGGVITVLSLSGTSALAQSSPTDAATSWSPVASRLRGSPTLSEKPPGVPLGRRLQVGQQRQSPYFNRWGIELSVGSEALAGLRVRSRPRASFCPQGSTSAALSPSSPRPARRGGRPVA